MFFKVIIRPMSKAEANNLLTTPMAMLLRLLWVATSVTGGRVACMLLWFANQRKRLTLLVWKLKESSRRAGGNTVGLPMIS